MRFAPILALITFQLSAQAQAVDTREMGTKIVRDLHALEDRETEGEAAYDFWNDTEIQLVFFASDAQLIARNGFWNQHQTGALKGTGVLEGKLRAEDEIAGIAVESLFTKDQQSRLFELLPKYAFLGLMKKFGTLAETSLRLAAQYGYGDTVAVLKNEVKARSTFTTRDSFGVRNIADSRNTFFWRPETLNLKVPPATNYWEAQVWGQLEIGDVDHLIVLENNPDRVARLKTLGLPIYEASPTFYPGGAFQPGRLIYKPE